MATETTAPAHTPIAASKDGILLDVKNLTKHFPIRRGLFSGIAGYVKAVTENC